MEEDDRIPKSVKSKFRQDIDEQIKISKANKRKESKKIKKLGKLKQRFEQ
jgi:hypothetical protein